MLAGMIGTYGYLAVFAGTLLEGETILVAAGFAAHRGLLEWPIVVLVAIIGGTLGDQLAFLLGRWKGRTLIERIPALAQHKPRIDALLLRYDVFIILIIRFLYGLRIAGPVILGASPVPLLRFALFNVIGAIIWAILVAGAGYSFGYAITALFTHVERIQETALLAILGLGAAIWLWHRYRNRPRRY